MNLLSLNAILAQASNAVAQGTNGAAGPMQESQQAQMIKTVSMLGIMIFLFYFLLIRPQSKKAKEQAAMLKTIKPGDKVITGSGIVGIVVAVKEKEGTVSLRSAETKLEVLKSAITDIKKSDGETAES